MKSAMLALAATAFVAGSVSAQVPTGKMGELRPDQKQFFDLYKQLVETDTSITSVDDPANGGCTQAAAQIAERLKAAGFGDDQITLFSVPDHPKELTPARCGEDVAGQGNTDVGIVKGVPCREMCGLSL